MTLASILASAVWLTCPAYQLGEPYPVPAQVGCPVPVSGLIYPISHEDDIESARLALVRSAAALRECGKQRDDEAATVSPLVWVALGAVAGATAIGIAGW